MAAGFVLFRMISWLVVSSVGTKNDVTVQITKRLECSLRLCALAS